MKAGLWRAIKLIAIFIIASPLLLTLIDGAVSHYNNKRIQEAVAKKMSQYNPQDMERNSSR